MITDRLRKWAVFQIYKTRGQDIGKVFRILQSDVQNGIPPDTAKNRLIAMLDHSRNHVPYYRSIIRELGDSYREDPFEYLKHMPVLTKAVIRENFEDLKSDDLPKRRWYVNTTGGSTGEPVEFVQDREFNTLNGPVTSLISWLIGADIGEPIAFFWGSIHDIRGAEEGWKAKSLSWLSNNRLFSVYHLDSRTIDHYLDEINRRPPKLIIGYANSMNEIAKYIEKTGRSIRPQNAVITSAGMLYPEFRQTIERVFQCKVYDRYGSREVGSIAAERPGYTGMWVPPWTNYLEISDTDGQPVPDGMEGEILVTSFCNYAMPLIRYQIGDRGVLAPPDAKNQPPVGQVLERLTGRTVETYYNAKGEVIDPSHFMPILYHLDWIRKYQVVQTSPSSIIFRIVKNSDHPPQSDLLTIINQSRGVMNDAECQVDFQYVDDILPTRSGKFNFIVNEMKSTQGMRR